jgi:hypothetical protein
MRFDGGDSEPAQCVDRPRAGLLAAPQARSQLIEAVATKSSNSAIETRPGTA